MFPLSRFQEHQPEFLPITVTQDDLTPRTYVTDRDNESFAYFLSDPTCNSFKLTDI